MRRPMLTLALFAGLAACAGGAGMAGAAQKGDRAEAPDVTGRWTGTWATQVKNGTAPAMQLDADVVRKRGGKYEATFEGECGRPYKYTIRMEGRQAGKAVLFKGTADLGEKDGGVYDWIGRANGTEFLGFYTSQGYTGTFRLTRPQAQP